MGKYYSGDISGKFWVGIQNSDAGERFGAEAQECTSIPYYVSDTKINKVREEIEIIENNLGGYLRTLNKFFGNNNGYTNEMLVEAGIPENKINYLLSEYADLELGKKILKCLEDNCFCYFEAEL
jgi:hypothetical protein